MPDDMPREDVVAAMDAIIRDLLEQAGVDGPPVDAISIARKHLGMSVTLDSRQSDRGRVQRAGRKPRIFLRPEPTEERHQWTVAHEIGRHLKDTILERLDLQPDEAKSLTGDSLMTLFSSRFLVPSVWFAEDAAACRYDLPQLKEKYKSASNEVVALRFLDLPFPTIVTVIDNGDISRRKSNGPNCKTTALEETEKRCWEEVSNQGAAHSVNEGSWSVQGWAIHTSDWKREILRSVVDDIS